MLRYDDDPTLSELLSARQQAMLVSALSTLADARIDVVETADVGVPVEFNLRPVGYVTGNAAAEKLSAAANIIEIIAMLSARYCVAANMHVEGMRGRYEELQLQHKAVEESEARYRQLSAELQGRVNEQVNIVAESQQRLYEDARLRSVGQLAAGVAHEINTPIGFIISNMSSARKYLDDLVDMAGVGTASEMLDDFRALISESLDGAGRVASIVTHLRTFSAIDRDDFEACDVASLTETAVHLLKTELPANTRIELRVNDIPLIAGHPGRISQAIYNVIHNAVQAVADTGGTVVVECRMTNGSAEVVVEDDGPGIPDELAGRVFDPFFTSREVGGGMGLGLTVARDVMRAHGGRVSVGRRDSGGCRISMCFHVE